jgi:hypothetical protein
LGAQDIHADVVARSDVVVVLELWDANNEFPIANQNPTSTLMMWGIRLDPRGEATGNRRTTSRVP